MVQVALPFQRHKPILKTPKTKSTQTVLQLQRKCLRLTAADVASDQLQLRAIASGSCNPDPGTACPQGEFAQNNEGTGYLHAEHLQLIVYATGPCLFCMQETTIAPPFKNVTEPLADNPKTNNPLSPLSHCFTTGLQTAPRALYNEKVGMCSYVKDGSESQVATGMHGNFHADLRGRAFALLGLRRGKRQTRQLAQGSK